MDACSENLRKSSYSSLLRRGIPLQDVGAVSYEAPTAGDFFALYLLGPVFLLFFGLRPLQHRLLVNGEVVYAGGNALRPAFWVELLKVLGDAAREEAGPDGMDDSAITATRPAPGPPAESEWWLRARESGTLVVTVLETTPHDAEGRPLGARLVHEPTWEQIEEALRTLDGHRHPLVRLWAGEPEDAPPALEVTGGAGKYALRERGDGWVYYDSAQGDDQVQVQTSGEGYCCPTFYVCLDLGRVLEIARRFCETARFDDSTEIEERGPSE